MTKNKQNLGTASMFTSSFNYALYPVLLSIAAFTHFLPKDASLVNVFTWGFALVAVKELANLLFQLTYMSIKRGIKVDGSFFKSILVSMGEILFIYKNIFKNHLSNRYGWMIIGAAFLAGPLGYTIETVGINLAGPTIGTLLVNLTPIFVLLLTKAVFKKKKITPYVVLLTVLIVIVVLANSIAQYFAGGNESKDVIIALSTGAGTAVLWSLENIIMAYVSKKRNMDHNEVLVIKLTSSALVIPLFILPIISAIGGDVHIGYDWYTNLFTNTEFFSWVIGIGAIMFLARWTYFYSIKNSPTTISSLTLIIRFAWVPILQLIIYAIVDKEQSGVNWYIFVPFSLISWTLTILLVIHEQKIDLPPKAINKAKQK